MNDEANDPIDGDQLPVEDTLDDRGVEDALDEGYSPPEGYRGVTSKSVTAHGEIEGETIDERILQEEPDPEASLTYGDEPGEEDEALDETLEDGEVGDRRSGRIEQIDGEPDGFGRDDGFAGGAASAEEAAMHEIPDEP